MDIDEFKTFGEYLTDTILPAKCGEVIKLKTRGMKATAVRVYISRLAKEHSISVQTRVKNGSFYVVKSQGGL